MESEMLVLSRNTEQAIRIGNDITVTVLSVNADGRVKLGIAAPLSVRVDREEVRERREAAGKVGVE